jgi:hypothetical protein
MRKEPACRSLPSEALHLNAMERKRTVRREAAIRKTVDEMCGGEGDRGRE